MARRLSARQLRPVGLDFADTAPLRLSFTADLGVAVERVYVALADELEVWPRWFTAVTELRPTAGGKGREVRLKGGGFFEETVLAALPGEQYAYRIDRTNAPGLRAMVEDWHLAVPPAGGARVRWTMAVDGTPALRTVLRLGRAGLGVSFRDAMRKLERRLRP
ncbi:SRPBCC family protein [Streptomyces oryzae]|uniref:SRPBCC family protein n=1 Tax=Streptomyces oryzae TaxID=1434886 RepID=A0ABS3X8N8_9ACTN|nr:SRPBCC family protein [Streptomyces oryzae]MBO8191744.1 SRPBCC family protein [Streptomyces oryzae]